MKTYYPIQVIDLRFQVDYLTPKKIWLFEEYDEKPTNIKLYVKLSEHREIKNASGRKQIVELNLFEILLSEIPIQWLIKV